MKTKTRSGTDTRQVAISHSMDCYFDEINRFHLLSHEEEIEFGKRIQKSGDPEAREKLINANLRLVVKIANEYGRFGLPIEDLVSEGNIGLMKAAEKYDPGYGVRFSTYAAWWIKQSIKRALGNQSRTIRLPLHVIQKLRDLDRAEQELGVELGRDPLDEELSQCQGLTCKKVAELRRVSQPVVSLEDQSSEHGLAHSFLACFVADESAPDPLESVVASDMREKLTEMLCELNPRQREVVELRFGLAGKEPQTLEQIGATFEVTRERIRQIQLSALKKLLVAIKRLERPKRPRVQAKSIPPNTPQHPSVLESVHAQPPLRKDSDTIGLSMVIPIPHTMGSPPLSK